MAHDPEEALPPYFGITPDEAVAELDPAVGTGDFGRIAALCARGRADLVARGHEATGIRYLVISQVENSRSRRSPPASWPRATRSARPRAQSAAILPKSAVPTASSSSPSASSGAMLK